MPVRVEDRDEIVARINRKYDKDLRRGDEIESAPRISTGSLELDVAMGGGVPIGRFSRLYGGYSSAKTLTTYNIISQAQKMGLTCAYYNVEKQYGADFVAARGVNTHELTIVEGTTIEEIGEKLESLLGVVHVHVIDSCSAAVSEDELNADIRDWRPGLNARAWGKVFRRINERFDHFENTIITVDQVRTNFKTGGEDPAGGRILDHQPSMTISFKRGGWIWRNAEGYLDEKAKQEKGSSGQIEPSGIEIKARVEKSRVCRPLRTATMRLDLDTLEFDRLFELTKAAKHYNVVETTSNGRYQHHDYKMHGDKSLREYIQGDLTLQEEIREVALTASNR